MNESSSPVITITIDTNRHIKVHVGVGVIGLGLSQIPLDSTATQHGTGKSKIDGILCTDDTNVLSSVNPQRVGVQ